MFTIRNLSKIHPARCLLWFCGAALLSGCVHAPLNEPLLRDRPVAKVGFVTRGPPVQDDGVMVCLFFSGGGTRAAALSYGVLKELANTRLTTPQGDYRMIDKVESISAVSGGSFPAAYYCLYHDRIFVDFEDRFLKKNVTSALMRKMANPINWSKLMSPYYGRSDLAAEYYDQLLFHGATFADLKRGGGHPFLVLNATDMANGEQFPFVAQRFELIASDLDKYPISRAVAAASAFPLLLSPITLKNFRGSPSAKSPEPGLTFSKEEESHRNQIVRKVFTGYGDYSQNPYVHLVDGATSDNLGLESVIDADVAYGGMESEIERILGIGPRKRLVMIIVNASVDHTVKWSQREAVPGVASEFWRLASDFGEHSDAEYLDLAKFTLDRWQRDSAARLGSSGVKPEYYLIPIDFTQLSDGSVIDFFENLPTNFYLPPSTVDRVVAAGEKLLRDSPDYQRLLNDLRTPH